MICMKPKSDLKKAVVQKEGVLGRMGYGEAKNRGASKSKDENVMCGDGDLNEKGLTNRLARDMIGEIIDGGIKGD